MMANEDHIAQQYCVGSMKINERNTQVFRHLRVIVVPTGIEPISRV